MSLTPGTSLGPYEILAPLGTGGMGEVYRAHDTRLGRDVAIKVLAQQLAATAEVRARFEREARTISQLNHPHICTLHDIGHQDGVDYLVMELLEGETLAHRLEKGPLPLAEVLAMGSQIADALDRAHRAGVVHRDLKPGNIMLTKSGAKLMDFGLARVSGLAPASGALADSPTLTRALTAEGMLVGTFQYMAPEQLEGKEADARTDIWALGCVLYEMATGKRAFEGDSQASLIVAILDREPRPLLELQPLSPPALEHLVRRCLAKDPDKRWQSASDLARELEWVTVVGSQAAAAAPAVALPARRSRLAWLVVALLGIGAGAVIATAVQTHVAGSHVVSFQPKTFQQYPIFRARFEPDGQGIVFSAAPVGNTPELYSVRPEYIAPRPLGLRGVHLLSISSSGQLAVLTGARHRAHTVFSGTLAQLPLGAEAPREILENVRDADWSPDGSGLAIIREVEGRDRLEYPMGKILFESGGYLSDLRFSPRGDRIAFFDHPTKWDNRGSVKVVDLAGRATELSSGHAAEEGIAWSPDGKRIYFSAAGSGFSYSVYAVALSGKRRVVQQSAGSLRILDISRTRRWLATRDDIRLGIMVRAPGADSERDMSWLESSALAEISSDGRTVLFTEQGGANNANYVVCLRRTDGSPVVQLGEGFAQALSPDGKWALTIVPKSPMQAVLYPTGAGDPVKLDRGSIEAFEAGAWFPDGHRVILCGVEPRHGPRVYVQEISGGGPRAITPENTRLGVLSPDGTMVMAQRGDGTWSLYPVEGDAPRPVTGLTDRDIVIRWSADGRSVLVFDQRRVPCRVEQFTLSNGQRDLVVSLGTENRTGQLGDMHVSIADDLRVYAYSHYDMLSALFVVEGAR